MNSGGSRLDYSYDCYAMTHPVNEKGRRSPPNLGTRSAYYKVNTGGPSSSK